MKLAAQSNDAAFRLAGLAALGECGSADGLEILITAARKAAPEDGTMVSRALLSLAGSLQSKGQVKEAGMAYLAALETISDMGRRAEALRGLAACPIPDAFEQVKTMISDKDLQEPAMDALVAVAGTLAAANQKDKALDAYETVRKLNPPVATAQAIAKGLHSLGVKIDLAAMMGLVTRWWVVGPFELDPENKGWANDWIGEPNVKLDASYKSGNKTVSWKSVTTDDANGKIDLRATLADRERCVGYACAEVGVKESCDAVLLIGVDDSERVWVNGQKVYERFVPGGLQVDSDRIPVKLKAGRNTILMKIWQNNLGWEFCARLTLPDGRPVIFQQPEAAN